MAFGYQVLGFGAGEGVVEPYNVRYLVIAGGAQGGRSNAHGGGGGAGGYRTATCFELTGGDDYTITIGAGSYTHPTLPTHMSAVFLLARHK